jgi:hypothetical protein
MIKYFGYLILLSFLFINCSKEQSHPEIIRIADSTYVHAPFDPAYSKNKGPIVFVDEAHNNFLTKTKNSHPFIKILEDDGYQLHPLRSKIVEGILQRCKILIIANPLHDSNVNKWILPNPSAFTNDEINILKNWVSNGGSLLLIAGHMPFAGASSDLGSVFGFKFYNGYVRDVSGKAPSVFNKSSGRLTNHIINSGIDSTASFTGQAFEIPINAEALMIFDSSHKMFMPDTAGVFHPHTPSLDAGDLNYAAVLKYGKGKIAVTGGESLFTSQKILPMNVKFGINHPSAIQNQKFLLNLFHWLDKK